MGEKKINLLTKNENHLITNVVQEIKIIIIMVLTTEHGIH